MMDQVQAFAIDVLKSLTTWSMERQQLTKDNEYYVTLAELEAVIKEFISKYVR